MVIKKLQSIGSKHFKNFPKEKNNVVLFLMDRLMAHESKISKRTAHDKFKKGEEIKRVTSFIKPMRLISININALSLNILLLSGYFENLCNDVRFDNK